MNRIKGYFFYLLIPAVPYLLMMYRPDLIDPAYQYLAYGKGHRYVWLLLVAALLWGLHAGFCFDFKANNVKPYYISFTKWYFSLVMLLASLYVLLIDVISFKNLLIFVCFSIIAFYIFATTYGKNNA